MFNRILPLILLLFVSTFASVSYAQEENTAKSKPKPKFATSKTKRVKALGQIYSRRIKPLNEKFSKALDKEVEMTEAERQELLDEVFAGFKKLDVDNKWASHEYAHLYNQLAYFYYQNEEVDTALNYYIKASEQDDISPAMYLNIIKTIGQIYIGEEEYEKGLEYLEIWRGIQVADGNEVPASFLSILARLYYQLDDFRQSIVDIEDAINISETNETSGIAREDWYNLQRANYFNLKDYPKVKDILYKQIVAFQKPKYWVELGSVFSDLEQEDNIHNAYIIAFLLDSLTSHSKLSALGYMYANAGAPCLGAKILDDGVKKGVIRQTIQVYQTIANNFQRCYEYPKAIKAYKAATQLDETGESLGRLSTLYSLTGQRDLAISTGLEALQKGQLKNKAYVILTLVPEYMDMREYDKALQLLTQISNDEKYSKQVANWRTYLNREKTKFEEYAKYGIDIDAIYTTTDALSNNFAKLYQ